jgi:rubrerythrin
MKFKLDLNESLFDDEEFKETKHVFNEGDFDKYALDDEFCELDYELSNSEAAASKVDTSVIPEGPQPGPNSGIADLLIAAINDEWEAIRGYNSLVASLSYESNSNPQFAQMIEVINDINAEENKHVGQLQEILKAISPNAEMIKAGEQEGQKQFNFVNGKLPVQGAKIISQERGEIPYEVPSYVIDSNFVKSLFTAFGHTCKEVLIALGLIVGFFMFIELIYIRLPKIKLIQIGIGILYTFLGLVIFLSAVSVGFMPIGFKMGTQIAEQNQIFMVIFGFVLGLVVVLAEPAVHVLKKQVEQVTNGGVSQKSMLLALSIGVGISIALSMIRIIFDFSIIYYIIPGYIISLGLSFFVPKIYTAIAFDSGGVASGPLTSSFILPFAIGACLVLQGESKVMLDAFGIVSMVAMTPLITIQLLGFRAIMAKNVREKARMKKILDADDEQIINFM